MNGPLWVCVLKLLLKAQMIVFFNTLFGRLLTRWVMVGFRNTGINFIFTSKSAHLYKRYDPDCVPSLNMQVSTSCKKRKQVGQGTDDIKYTSPETERYSRRQGRKKILITQLLILSFLQNQ